MENNSSTKQILTHVVDGYIIEESFTPFSVSIPFFHLLISLDLCFSMFLSFSIQTKALYCLLSQAAILEIKCDFKCYGYGFKFSLAGHFDKSSVCWRGRLGLLKYSGVYIGGVILPNTFKMAAWGNK